MKCTLCKEKEAAFISDCLVVYSHTSTFDMNVGLELRRQYHTTEFFSGESIVAGLCPDCMKKVSHKIDREKSLPLKALAIYLLLTFAGVALVIWGFAGNLGELTSPVVIGGFVFLIGGLAAYAIHCLLLPRFLRKNAPWKLLGKPMDGVRLDNGSFVKLVPVGENYYKDSSVFNDVNDHLLEKVRNGIKKDMIDTGAWKAIVLANKIAK